MRLNQTHNMDCVEGMKLLSDKCIDLTVTSPPYGNLRRYDGYTWNFENTAQQLYRITKDGGVVVWVVADSTVGGGETCAPFEQALYFKSCGFKPYDTMIWEKPSPAVPTESRYYDVFEYMFVFSKGKPKTINLIADRKNKSSGTVSNKETRSRREDRKYTGGKRTVKEFSRRFNVWNISRGVNKTSHPAVFPLQLASDHILSWSKQGDLILDPFAGSGTTAEAAIQNNRNYIGFEISKEYCEMANERLTLVKKCNGD